MKVYSDIFTHDEMFTDSYPINLVNDLYYEVEGKNITKSNNIDESLIDGNKAPEGGEAVENDPGVVPSVVTGINVVLDNRLMKTSFDKTSFTDWLKNYARGLREHLEQNSPDRVTPFVAGMKKSAEEILGKFDEYHFYLGETMDTTGMVVLQYYREDGLTPVFIFFKDGLKEAKV